MAGRPDGREPGSRPPAMPRTPLRDAPSSGSMTVGVIGDATDSVLRPWAGRPHPDADPAGTPIVASAATPARSTREAPPFRPRAGNRVTALRPEAGPRGRDHTRWNLPPENTKTRYRMDTMASGSGPGPSRLRESGAGATSQAVGRDDPLLRLARAVGACHAAMPVRDTAAGPDRSRSRGGPHRGGPDRTRDIPDDDWL